MKTTISVLELLSSKCHEVAKERGWWDKPLYEDDLMYLHIRVSNLILSELSECFEGLRSDKQDDHLPQYKMEVVELADVLIRVFDYYGFLKDYLNGEYPVGYDICKVNVETHAEMTTDLCFQAILMKGYFIDYRGEGDENKDNSMFFKHKQLRYMHKAALKNWPEDFLELVYLVIYYCDKMNLPLVEAFDAKMKYNKTRKDHSREARAAADGKKF